MSSSRKDSPVGNALAALFLFVLLPSIACMNYGDFMSRQEGRIARTYWTGQKSPTLHHVLSNGQELHAWNLWFGGFPSGREVVKHSGCFWAEVAPSASPPAWKRILSFFMFVPAVLLPALMWVTMILGLVEAFFAKAASALRGAPAVPRSGSGRAPKPAARATAIDMGQAEPRAARPVPSLAVVERAVDGCPTCGVEASGAPVPCGTCGARHFEGCWANHRTCNDAGCDGRPITRRAAA